MRESINASWKTIVGLCLTFGVAIAPHAASAKAVEFDRGMRALLPHYFAIHESLASDGTVGVNKAASAIAQGAVTLDPRAVTGKHSQHYKELPTKIRAAAVKLGSATGLEEARDAFRELSRPFAMWGTMAKPAGVDVVFCSMAKGSWLQETGGVKNPYYGASMLSCGEVVGGGRHGH